MIQANKYRVYSFYRFVEIKNKIDLKKKLENFLKNKDIKGTIIIADEGFNGSIAGDSLNLDRIIILLKKYTKIRKISLKVNTSNFLPFNKIKVRLKKEIVTLGIKNLKINNKKKEYIHPAKWDKFIKNKNIKLIDTRNSYEIPIGRFENSINPNTNSFREFPKKFGNLGLNKKSVKIAIYCTGGIRCEKASVYLKKIGYENVYQLDGGILNYLDFNNKNNNKNSWVGDCFVFDKRVAINKKLKKSNYEQCYGCRSPLSVKEMKSKLYKKGIHCPKCFHSRTLDQKKRSTMRQMQIDSIKNKNI